MLKNHVLSMNDSDSKVKSSIPILARILIIGVVSFFLANSKIAGMQSPLIVGLVGATQLTESIAAFLGALLAYFFTGQLTTSLTEVVSIILILVVKVISCEVLGKKLGPVANVIMTITTTFLSGFAIGFLTLTNQALWETILVSAVRAVLCGCFAYFLGMVIVSFKKEKKLVVSGIAGASLAIVFVLFIAALSSVSVSFFNLGRIVGILVLFLSAKKFKHVGGVICGTLITCGTVLCSPELGQSTMLLAGAGLVAGLFSEFGTVPSAFFFIAANAISLLVIGVTPQNSRLLVDVMFASIAFIAIPERLILTALGVASGVKISDKATLMASSRLGFAAKTIGDVKTNVEQITRALEKRVKDNDVVMRTCDEVCGRCKNNLYCWESSFDTTFSAFTEVKKMLEQKGKITSDDLPQHFQRCIKRLSLTDGFNYSFKEEIAENRARQKLSSMRSILYEQFSGMEDMLEEISVDMSEPKDYDNVLAKEVKAFLLDFGAVTPQTSVYYDITGIMKIEAFYSGDLTLSRFDIVEGLAEITDRELELPEIFVAKDFTKLCVIEKAKYALEIATSVESAIPGDMSGDTYESFYDGSGNAYFIISDGMGSGKAASIDSMMASSLMVRLLKAGVGYSAAIKLINSSMLVKSGNESFATLDIACINLHTGKLKLIKLGAAATFVKIGGRVSCIEASSQPIGIVDNIRAEHKHAVMKDGDMLVMISDGVGENVYSYVKSLLIEDDNLTPQGVSEKIMVKTLELSENQKRDDVTIFTIFLKKNR